MPLNSDAQPVSRARRLAGLAVHLYTALGALLGYLMVIAAIDGDTTRVLVLFAVAMFVDGTDGTLARLADVHRGVPWFDGALLDNIVDYLTYVFAPIVLLRQAGFLPSGWAGTLVAALPLLSSCYQFCRTDAKTEDHAFLGFPDYWNVVAFYAVVLDASVPVVTAVLVACTVLVFVPVRFLYPSRTTVLRTPTLLLTAAYGVAAVAMLVLLPDPPRWLVYASLGYVAYYLVASVTVTLRRRRVA